MRRRVSLLLLPLTILMEPPASRAQESAPGHDRPPARQTQRPPLHATEWLVLTGKPLAATAGAMMFTQGGNAIDAACAMPAASSTMWDALAWGGETQALIYNPNTRRVLGINALGVAPTGATPDSSGWTPLRQRECVAA